MFYLFSVSFAGNTLSAIFSGSNYYAITIKMSVLICILKLHETTVWNLEIKFYFRTQKTRKVYFYPHYNAYIYSLVNNQTAIIVHDQYQSLLSYQFLISQFRMWNFLMIISYYGGR